MLVRDDVVHCHEPRLPALPSGEPQTLRALIGGTEELLRAALQRGITLEAPPRGPPAA